MSGCAKSSTTATKRPTNASSPTSIAAIPSSTCPEVIDQYSTTQRVLTTEFADGARWDEMLGWSQDERNLAAETIYRFAFGSLYRLEAFNGDPHPGNYLFHPGRSGHLPRLRADQAIRRRRPRRVRGHDEDDGASIAICLRFVAPSRTSASCDRDTCLHRRRDRRLLRPLLRVRDERRRQHHHTPSTRPRTVRRFFDTSGPYGEIMKAANVPASMVIIQRINLGLYAIFGEMRATANWRRIAEELWPFVAAPPSTPMGEAIAAWQAERARRGDRVSDSWVERDCVGGVARLHPDGDLRRQRTDHRRAGRRARARSTPTATATSTRSRRSGSTRSATGFRSSTPRCDASSTSSRTARCSATAIAPRSSSPRRWRRCYRFAIRICCSRPMARPPSSRP